MVLERRFGMTATWTFTLANNGNVVEGTSSLDENFVIPANASVAFPVGTVIAVYQAGAGQITVVPASGVTLQSNGGLRRTSGQFATIGLRKRAKDIWSIFGDLA